MGRKRVFLRSGVFSWFQRVREVFVEKPGCLAARGGVLDEIGNTYFFPDAYAEDRKCIGVGPPALLFRENRRRAGDVDYAQVGPAAYCNIGSAPLERDRLPECRACAFGEDEDAPACVELFSAGDEHFFSAAVGDVVCGADDAAHEKVIPERLLHHAITTRHKRGEKNVIKEARMVGHDEAASVIVEAFGIFYAEINRAEDAHEDGKITEADVDAALGDEGLLATES
jgi:hypothetical protein